MIFLSDGECPVPVEEIHDVCRSAVGLGWVAFCLRQQTADCLCRKPLSFHAVSFGQERLNYTLRQMAEVALEIQNDAFRRPMLPTLPSSFTTALDTVSTLTPFYKDIVYRFTDVIQVRLAEAFLSIAESLRNPRGSLVC